MASGTSTSAQETSSAVIESVIDTSNSAGVPAHQASNKDSKALIKDNDKKPTASVAHSDTGSTVAGGAGKDDSNDIVSQTTSGSAPVSVISSAQSMDPSKKDSASRDAYFAVKYNSLLANIAEVGRDVKPAYTNNKSSSERLRKNIVITRNTIRDLMVELEKYSRIAEENDMDYK